MKFANILLRIFKSILIKDIGLKFSFLTVYLSGFGITVVVTLQNEFRSVPFSSDFGNSLRTGISSSLYVWLNSPVKPSSPGFLFAGSFYYFKFSFTSGDQAVNYLFLLNSVFAGCMFLEICPFLLVCPMCGHITIHSILISFYTSVVLVFAYSYLFIIWIILLLSPLHETS